MVRYIERWVQFVIHLVEKTSVRYSDEISIRALRVLSQGITRRPKSTNITLVSAGWAKPNLYIG